MKRAHCAVVREEAERLRPRRETREHGDAERRVCGETARSRDLPEDEIHLGLLRHCYGGAGGGAHGGSVHLYGFLFDVLVRFEMSVRPAALDRLLV